MDSIFPYSDMEAFLDKARPIVKECLRVIENSGISAADAEAIPEELLSAIVESNRKAKGETSFKAY